jgi:hypothetical protein
MSQPKLMMRVVEGPHVGVYSAACCRSRPKRSHCCCCLLLLSLLPDDCSVPPDSMDGVAALGELTGLTQLVMLTALKVCWGARDYF